MQIKIILVSCNLIRYYTLLISVIHYRKEGNRLNGGKEEKRLTNCCFKYRTYLYCKTFLLSWNVFLSIACYFSNAMAALQQFSKRVSNDLLCLLNDCLLV